LIRLARALPVLITLVTVTIAAAAAGAEPEDVKRADLLFREGQKLLKAGHVPEACDAFAQSQRFDPAVGTLLNLAECHAQERHFASAHAEFLEAARLARESGQHEREVFAKEQAAMSEAVLSFVELRVPPGVETVTIDDRSIARDALAKPLPLDPGMHAVVAAGAPGKGLLSRTMQLEVKNGPSSQVFEIAPLDSAGEVAPVAPPPTSEDHARPRRIAGLATAGVGVVALGLGAFFGLRAAGKKSDAEPHCNGRFCDAEGLDLQDSAHAAATASTVAFVVGVLAVGAGSYLYFSVPRPAKGIARARVVPTGAGLRLEAAW
jgi:hypothetical protein